MILSRRANKQTLFVDMNSFFASCEQAERPELVGKPVIVVPTANSCALSASYEAKAFGIKTTTPEREARFLCPQVAVVNARPKLYMEYHHRFVKILENLTPHVTVRSVDEASIALCRNEDPWELAGQIKAAIWQQLGPAVNCSIGIAPNVFLAKLATELQKPNGLVEIKLNQLEEIYGQIGLRDLCGINYAMERRLNRLGIYSPLDFYKANANYLRHALGIIGERWWLKLHGYTVDESVAATRKSLSHSHVLPPAYRQPETAYVTLQRLVTKVGRRLRKEGVMACHLSLSIRYPDRTYFFHGFKIRPTADTLTLGDHATHLWRLADPRQPVLKLAVWTHDLVPAISVPTPLFPEERKRFHLAQAIDKVNDRYGTDTLRFAILDQKGSRAPDRIAFNSLYEIEHE